MLESALAPEKGGGPMQWGGPAEALTRLAQI